MGTIDEYAGHVAVRPALRGAVAAVGAAGLVAVAAMAGGLGRGGGGDGPLGDARWVLDVAASLLALAVAGAAVAAGFALWPRARRRRRKDEEAPWVHEAPPFRWWERPAALLGLFVGVGASFVPLAAGSRRPGSTPPTPTATPGRGSAVTRPPMPGGPAAGSAPGIVFDWWIPIAVLGAVGVAVVVASAAGRAPPARPVEAPAVRQQVGRDAVAVSLAEVRAESDDRRAVVAAYAVMETVLEHAGLARARWETPLEYLERVLLSAGQRGAVAGRLSELFELAKFSHHRVGPEMKQAAVASLEELQRELEPAG